MISYSLMTHHVFDLDPHIKHRLDNSEVRLPYMPPVSPSDVSSLKPCNVLLRGGSVRHPNWATMSCIITSPLSLKLNISYETPEHCCHLSPAIPSSNHLGFSIPSGPSASSSKQNVQCYLTSSQLVILIGCRGIPAVLDNYLGKALAIRLGRRAADS